MKPIGSSFVTFVLAICVFLIVNVNQTAYGHDTRASHQSNEVFATGVANSGRLIIHRAPTLGHNVRIDVVIDGRLAGLLSRARTFDSYITPGRHLLLTIPNCPRGAWYGMLEVRPGHTYHYTATYNVSRLVLYRDLDYR